MSPKKGVIALMGSGELTATMVEVHKELLSRLGNAPRVLFLDTPAGFQLNADQLSQKAVEYFRVSIGYPMEVVSFKARSVPAREAEMAFQRLREVDYLLVGPGSPTYAIRNWKGTPIRETQERRIEKGACLVAASAAALTVGHSSLPVYEIYKVGEDLHWVEGLDILGHFGLNVVVVPHWNNAEGGTHDTRFCFMGEDRFRMLQALLTKEATILGIDEHTACIVDLDREEISVRGIGTVTLRHGAFEKLFVRGERFPFSMVYAKRAGAVTTKRREETSPAERTPIPEAQGFWNSIRSTEALLRDGLVHDARDATNALLEFDRLLWQAQQDKENPEFISQARELFREFIVLFGIRLATAPKSARECLTPLVEEFLELRAQFRENNQWYEADAIRDCLKRAHIEVDDTPEGYVWRVASGPRNGT